MLSSMGGAGTLVMAGYRPIAGEGWSLAVPSSWSDVDPAPDGASWAAFDSAWIAGGFAANANLVMEPFDGSALEYARVSVQGLLRKPRRDPESAGAICVMSKRGVEAEIVWRRGNVLYRTIQRFEATGTGTGYVLTCAAAEEGFDSVRPVCEAVLRSFRIAHVMH